MAFGQRYRLLGKGSQQGTVAQRRGHHGCMPRAGDAVRHHARHVDRAVIAQAMDQGPGRLRHGAGIDHRQHRQAEGPRQVGGGRRAVVQTHDSLDKDGVGRGGRLGQQGAAALRADHPQVERFDGRAAGARQHHRVDEIGAALEHPHTASGPHELARQRRGHGGLALAGSRCGQQYGAGYHSVPGCAAMPALKACLMTVISVTVSAASISSCGAARPVTTACCIAGRSSRSAITWCTSR